MAQETNYETIDRPYDYLMNRSDQSGYGGSSVEDVSGGEEVSNGSVEAQTVKSDGAMGDVWISNSIRSVNWKPKSVGFYINGVTGYAEFTDVQITGNVHSLTGTVGGFTINTDSITDAANSFGLSSNVTAGDDVRFWAGTTFANRATAPFRVTEAGIISASSGTVGGCVIAPTSIGSTTFVSGPSGSGWNISNTGIAEFQNAIVRGIIRTSVFEKDTVSAVNGMVLISKADVLESDMTALDASTITIRGETTFVANEVLRIKDGTDDEWMLVTNAASAPTYTVTRDLASTYTADTNPIWKKGTAVVSMGVGTGTKTGFVLLDSSSSNSPFIDVYGRNSNTYTDYTMHGRFGWLKGITDADVGLATTDVWGLYTDNAYIKGAVVATSGKFGTTTNYWSVGATGLTAVSASTDVIINYGKTDFTNTDAGFILGYDYSSSAAKFYLGNATSYLNWTGTALNIKGDITGSTGTFSGTVTVSSIDIGGDDTTSAHIDTDGNQWWGASVANKATAPARVSKEGQATFVGVTTLNMKAYTNFENSGRFILTGDVAPVFGNQGMTVAPGAVATHYARALWWVTGSVFNNEPTFTCSLYALDGFEVGDGVAYIGLGNPTISGSSFTEQNKNHCGFEFKKTAGVTTITLIQCDGSGSVDFENSWLTVENGDSIELFLKLKSTGIEYWNRKNGGALSAVTTLTDYMPSGSETYISFMSSNKASTDDFKLQMQCAAYEH